MSLVAISHAVWTLFFSRICQMTPAFRLWLQGPFLFISAGVKIKPTGMEIFFPLPKKSQPLDATVPFLITGRRTFNHFYKIHRQYYDLQDAFAQIISVHKHE